MQRLDLGGGISLIILVALVKDMSKDDQGNPQLLLGPDNLPRREPFRNQIDYIATKLNTENLSPPQDPMAESNHIRIINLSKCR